MQWAIANMALQQADIGLHVKYLYKLPQTNIGKKHNPIRNCKISLIKSTILIKAQKKIVTYPYYSKDENIIKTNKQV